MKLKLVMNILKMAMYKRGYLKDLFSVPVLQTDPVRDQGDKLGVCGFSLPRVDRIAEQRIQRLHPSSAPCDLNGVPDCTLHPA